jgi:hypothetical protein
MHFIFLAHFLSFVNYRTNYNFGFEYYQAINIQRAEFGHALLQLIISIQEEKKKSRLAKLQVESATGAGTGGGAPPITTTLLPCQPHLAKSAGVPGPASDKKTFLNMNTVWSLPASDGASIS